MAVDVNVAHLAVAVVAADGNVLGVPFTVPLGLAGLPAATRDGRLRSAVSRLIETARRHGARAIAIEDLDFAGARAEGRERTGSRPSHGKRGRGFRRTVSGIPTARFRDRMVQMTANSRTCIDECVADPAYLEMGGAQHWLAPAAKSTTPRRPGTTRQRWYSGDASARPPGQEKRDREPHRPGGRSAAPAQARTRKKPDGQARTPGNPPPHEARAP